MLVKRRWIVSKTEATSAGIIAIFSISLDMLTTIYNVNRFGINVETNPSSRYLLATPGFIGWYAINLSLAALALIVLYALNRRRLQYGLPITILSTASLIYFKMVPGVSNIFVALGYPGLLG